MTATGDSGRTTAGVRDWTTHPAYRDGYRHGQAHAAGRIHRANPPDWRDWEGHAAYTAGYIAAAGWSEPEEDES